ncbi:hypothetical protein ACIQU6_43035 [Streptomyces sp. NPDC090442]|uniref:hypothetical protein n=1 Tax=Streptomyces sp. NPDC090442 TaxID=3365962 RepID=UPI00380D558D
MAHLPPPTKTASPLPCDAHRAGSIAAAHLAAALARLGVTLPSLRASWPVNGSGFVELGGCGAEPVMRIVQRLNEAADALEATVRQEGEQ